MEVSSIFLRIRRYIEECRRVFKVTKKPTTLEFKTIVKVSALGIAVIGMIGFIIQLLRELLL